MAKKGTEKTNVMRILEHKKIPYTPHSYPHGDEAVDGLTVAGMIGVPPERVFKTLVARGASKTPYVFVIPVCGELDLKKAAQAVGEKSIAMLHVSELTPLTGYVRGGCTAIGLKKNFVTRLDAHAKEQDRIYISGGKVGCQILLSPDDFIKTAWKAEYADLIRD